MREAMIVWDFFLGLQRTWQITGDFFEIGVFKGRSAVLGALHLQPEEWCVLLDRKPLADAEKAISSFRTERNKYLCCLSSEARDLIRVKEHFGKCRWVHIDGDHKGFSVANDLSLAADLIHETGIICVDDFFSYRYPQLTAATYRFLINREPEFQIVFAGNKQCYICRADVFQRYDTAIRKQFLPLIQEHGLNLQLNRTSYAADSGCFTVSWREGDRVFVGPDGDMDRMIY